MEKARPHVPHRGHAQEPSSLKEKKVTTEEGALRRSSGEACLPLLAATRDRSSSVACKLGASIIVGLPRSFRLVRTGLAAS